MKIGDTIQCTSANQCINIMTRLARYGVQTDFLYEKDGKEGLWLEVVKIEHRLN